jgi:hypothetical protein
MKRDIAQRLKKVEGIAEKENEGSRIAEEHKQIERARGNARKTIIRQLDMTPDEIRKEDEARYQSDIESGNEKRIASAKIRKKIMEELGGDYE